MKLRKNCRKKTNESFQQRVKDSFFFDLKKQGGHVTAWCLHFCSAHPFFKGFNLELIWWGQRRISRSGRKAEWKTPTCAAAQNRFFVTNRYDVCAMWVMIFTTFCWEGIFFCVSWSTFGLLFHCFVYLRPDTLRLRLTMATKEEFSPGERIGDSGNDLTIQTLGYEEKTSQPPGQILLTCRFCILQPYRFSYFEDPNPTGSIDSILVETSSPKLVCRDS